MLSIRHIAESDKAEWTRLWTGYLDFYGAALNADAYDTAFSRILSDDPQEFHGLIAEKDGKAAGLVHYLFHRHMWKTENVVYLQDLYADPEMRGKGIGRALIEAVYQAADAAGCPSVYWLTQDFNTEARRLYDRIGKLTPFIRYGRV